MMLAALILGLYMSMVYKLWMYAEMTVICFVNFSGGVNSHENATIFVLLSN